MRRWLGCRWARAPLAHRTRTDAAHAAQRLESELAQVPLPEPVANALPLPEDRGFADLEQTLKRLETTASVLMIVPHPDDEDGALLTYLTRGLGVRATLLTFTRGEGGQNAMSADSYDALGLIRTNELLKADEYYGAQATVGHRGGLRLLEDTGRGICEVGPRSRALRCGAGDSHGAAAGASCRLLLAA